MLKHRVIPTLLIQDDALVKTIKFSAPKYIGDPINAIRIFNDKEVDELLVLDISNTRENRIPDYSLIEQFATECFMPLCYGGGISTLDQASTLFNLGVEKICIQNAYIQNPRIISQISEKYGSQSVVVSLDLKKTLFGGVKIFDYSRRKYLHANWLNLVQRAIKFGAGEILLNSVDNDGLMQGMAIDIISEASDNISVPLIAAGGVGNLDNIKAGIEAGASAIGVGSYFVFHGPHRAVLITYPKYAELETLLKGINR